MKYYRKINTNTHVLNASCDAESILEATCKLSLENITNFCGEVKYLGEIKKLKNEGNKRINIEL